MSQRVELNGRDTKTHFGMENSWEGFEVEEQEQKDKTPDVFTDYGLMRAYTLKVERDQVGGVLESWWRERQQDFVHGGGRHFCCCCCGGGGGVGDVE